LQAEPQQRWTVTRLARAVGLSRAAFARRFSAATGESPLRYLAELRLALAATSLEAGDESLAELARRVGYASEFAFSRAFKRRYGVAPGTYRRGHRTPVTTCLLAAA
jgi:AraC-like DNA-binding protein